MATKILPPFDRKGAFFFIFVKISVICQFSPVSSNFVRRDTNSSGSAAWATNLCRDAKKITGNRGKLVNHRNSHKNEKKAPFWSKAAESSRHTYNTSDFFSFWPRSLPIPPEAKLWASATLNEVSFSWRYQLSYKNFVWSAQNLEYLETVI